MSRLLKKDATYSDLCAVPEHFVAEIIGDAGGNILEGSPNRLMTGVSAKSADLGLVIEARDAAHAADIRKGLEQAGYKAR